MSYATYDFTESLDRVGITPKSIASVIAAWGGGSGQGDDAGHYRWSEHGVTDWGGGFLMRLTDGRFAYVTGWCDYTGWGCQDGATVQYFDAEPSLDSLKAEDDYTTTPPTPDEWDREPVDLNRWLAQQLAEKPA